MNLFNYPDITVSIDVIISVLIALGGLVVALLKLSKNWKEVKVERSVITMMHDELTRLSDQNRILSSELNKFQLEIIKLTEELNDLSNENNKLRNELQLLTIEISRLQNLMSSGRDGDVRKTQF